MTPALEAVLRACVEMSGTHEPREICPRCFRPARVCYCPHIRALPTRTRIVILQHPRERDVAINTARIAHLSLPNSELHVGLRFSGTAALGRLLREPEGTVALLYPGKAARDVRTVPPDSVRTLVVVDGTWAQTKVMVRENHELSSLPRVCFQPDAPSDYRIRREPAEDYVSTIESIRHVLWAWEPHGEDWDQLLRPFRAMVDTQIEHRERLRGGRVRFPKGQKPPNPRSPVAQLASLEGLVCVALEANAWPFDSETRDKPFADEPVFLGLCRPLTGELSTVVLRPSQLLAPGTVSHTRLSQDALLSGAPLGDAQALFRQFVRPGDRLCTWGRYTESLWRAHGGEWTKEDVDVRRVAHALCKGRAGGADTFLERMGASSPPPLGPGRGGQRLADLVAAVRWIHERYQSGDSFTVARSRGKGPFAP